MLVKEAVHNTGYELDPILVQLIASEDAREGVTSFLERISRDILSIEIYSLPLY